MRGQIKEPCYKLLTMIGPKTMQILILMQELIGSNNLTGIIKYILKVMQKTKNCKLWFYLSQSLEGEKLMNIDDETWSVTNEKEENNHKQNNGLLGFVGLALS